jgi:hypothetical protein
MVWYEKDNSYFIIGGQVDNSFNPHSSNEVRKYRDGHWSMVTPLPVRIKGAQSIVIQDRIFVLGNYHTPSHTSIIYKTLYDKYKKEVIKTKYFR